MSRFGYIYNHRKDVLDGTEPKFGVQHHAVSVANLPTAVDLRKGGLVPPILDQGQLGSCGPNELSNALRFRWQQESNSTAGWQPSRLFIYYFDRVLEGLPIDQDTGISVHGGLQTIGKYGACSENHWPYVISRFTEKPPAAAIAAAATHTPGFTYLSVSQDIVSLKQALVAGYSIVIGIQVYSSLEADSTIQSGNIPIPDTATEQCLGGHCVGLYGYDDSTQTFIMMNSWGTKVGQSGWFTLPYNYVLDPNLASDFWCITHFK